MNADTQRVSPGLILMLAAATVVAVVFHPTPLMLAIIGAALIVMGLVAAAAVAIANKRRGIPAMEGMLIPALLVFAGCAATILCDIDAAVQFLG